jgi:hypothetical protein
MNSIGIIVVSVIVIGILVRFISGLVVKARQDMHLERTYDEVLTGEEYKVKGRFA